MIELLTGWIGNLKNADHVGITTEIYDTVKTTDLSNETYKNTLAALKVAIENEDIAYRKTLKDWTVEQLKSTDARMDQYMKSIRSMLAGHASLPDGEPQKRPGAELLQLWKEYDFKLSNGYSAESTKVINMYQDVERRKVEAQALGIWEYFEKAKEQATKIQQLLDNRFTEMASRTVGELRNARAATDATIKQLYQVINSLQVLNPSDILTALSKKLKAIEDYARVYYLRTSISRNNSGYFPPFAPDGGGGDNGGGGGTNPPGGSAGGE